MNSPKSTYPNVESGRAQADFLYIGQFVVLQYLIGTSSNFWMEFGDVEHHYFTVESILTLRVAQFLALSPILNNSTQLFSYSRLGCM